MNIDQGIAKYLENSDLFFDFANIHNLGTLFSLEEKAVRQDIANRFSRKFNALDQNKKVVAFRRKISTACVVKELKKFRNIGTLKNVLDFTSTIDYRIPRQEQISHQVLCLAFTNANIFVKASRVNDYEEKYQKIAKRLGLPWIQVCHAGLNGDSQIILSRGIKSPESLSKTKLFSATQLGMHTALADSLNKGGRNAENYLVSGDNIYAIDNEFLDNPPEIFAEDLQKGYHELFALSHSPSNLSVLFDTLFDFVAGYKKAARQLKIKDTKLWQALSVFVAKAELTKALNISDQNNLIHCIHIEDWGKNISTLSKIISSSSPELRKALRQSVRITEQLFRFTPINGTSNNFDSKTFVLRDALLDEIHEIKHVLEIGPGCNATLSQFLRKEKPSISIEAIELNRDFIVSARKSTAINKTGIQILKGDIVKGIRKEYDLIFWNIPAVSSNKTILRRTTGKLFKSLERYATESDDGAHLIERFLNEAPRCLKPKGKILFASNTSYVPVVKIKKLIEASGLRLVKTYKQKSNTSQAYILAKP